MKTLVVKGKAPVDPECPKASSMHVFCEGDTIYDCMTNQVRDHRSRVLLDIFTHDLHNYGEESNYPCAAECCVIGIIMCVMLLL